MHIRINFLQRKSTKQRLWKTLTGIVGLSMVLNMSMAWVWLGATPLSAAPAANPSANLDQCANGGVGDPPVNCTGSAWQNGNLNDQHAHYVEGESVAYRALLEDLPTGGPITITFGYDVKHSDRHAIDYLTHYDRISETVTPTSGITGLGASSTFAFPEPSSAGSPVAGMPTNSFNALPPGERVMTIWNGTISNIAYATQGDLSDSNSETTINVTFTPIDSKVLFAWGGHIGSRLDWGYDGADPRSAGGISGSPYHMRLIGWTIGNLGQQDRSLSAGAVIPPGNVIIEKQTIPNGDPMKFGFTSATTGLSGTLGDGEQIVASLAPGQYSVTEGALPANWDLSSIVCSDTDSIGNTGTRTATINVSSTETVKCVFTNTYTPPVGRIIIDKVTVPTGSSQSFHFTTDFNAGFNLTDAAAPFDSGNLTAGTYAVSEDAVAGWDLSSATCSDQSPVSAIQLSAGETVTCTFTNTQRAKITVVKQTLPNGHSATFDFTGAVTATLSDGQSANSGWVAPNQKYSVTEAAKTGWKLTDLTCDTGKWTPDIANRSVELDVEPGDHITCTFTNTKLGTIIVEKQTDPNGDQTAFPFTGDVSGSISDGGTLQALSLLPGTYSATETPVAGWSLSSIACSDTDSTGSLPNRTATFQVAAGETVTCVFTNTRDSGTIKVNKILEEVGQPPVLNPNGWTWTLNNQTGIAGGTTIPVNTGVVLNVSEDNSFPPSWYSTSWSCIDAQSQNVIASGLGRDFTLANGVTKGQNVICTFTNNRDRGTLIVLKHVENDNNGGATAGAFTMHIKQGNGDFVNPFPGSETPVPANQAGTNTYVLPTGSYDVSETSALLGTMYNQVSITCDNQSTATVNVTKGGQHVCVIVNNDIAPTITLTKIVQNTNGGQPLGPNDFGLTIGGTPTTSGTTVPVNANTSYALNEVNPLPAGYEFVSLTGDQACPTQLGGSVSLNPGQNVSCTITNKTIRPQLTVIKNVVNGQYGQKQVSDFPLFVDGAGVTSGVTNGYDADSYVVSETGDASYSAAITGDCDANGNVTLNYGDSKTCTITNTYIPTAPQLAIEKTDNRTTANPGETLTYEVKITNSGETVATGVSVNDPVPSFLTNITNISHGGVFAAGEISWANLTINDKSSITLTFDATINPLMPFGTTVIHNDADLTSRYICTGEVGGGEVCRGDDDTTVDSTSTIVVAKAGAATVNPGGTLTYTINWSIAGQAPLTNAVLTDPIPTNTTFASQTCGMTLGTCTPSFAANIAKWELGNRNPGESGTVTLTVTVVTPLANGTVIVNDVTFDTNETNPTTAQARTTVTSTPTLQITKSNNISGFVNPGQGVIYTVTVSNATTATDTAKNVVLTDTLPNGFTFADTGLATKTIAVGDLAPGQSKTFTYNVNVSQFQLAGFYTNTASAKGDNTTTVTATSTVEVRVPTVLGETSEPSLIISKVVKPTVSKPGAIVTYTVTVKNIGDDDATNVTIVDTLPDGFTFVDTGTKTRTFVLGTIEPSHTRTLNYDVRIGNSVKAGKYDNRAVLTADGLEQQEVKATVTVQVPKVLGLATTGPSLKDYLIFLAGLLLTAAGAALALRARRHGAAQA